MTLSNLPSFVDIHEDVLNAIEQSAPIVALESTIITHGMPFPDNAEMAASVEALIRDYEVVPATIAVIDGRIKIGLTHNELLQLANVKNALKISRAFATGGIGGVHKGAETNFDISADLTELGKTDVLVVAAGAKAILDVPKTLEVLETQGVPVIGYQTNTLPAFWTRESNLDVPLRMNNTSQISDFLKVRDELHLNSGILIANPIPKKDEIPSEIIKSYIETAQEEMEKSNISGKDVTPFLLKRIFELSKGTSLKSNIALVKNNALIAAKIAKDFYKK